MNRLFGIIVVLGLIAACVAGYWYVNPHHMPYALRSPAPGFEIPTPRSPVNNFKPPQF